MALKNCIWPWFDGEYKVYCDNNQDYRQIRSWKGARHGSTYFFPDGSARYDAIIPRNLHNRAAQLLGLNQRVRTCASVRKMVGQVIERQ